MNPDVRRRRKPRRPRRGAGEKPVAVAVSIGDLRNKSAPSVVSGGTAGRLYGADLPVLVSNVERGTIRIEIFIPDAMSNQEALALLGSGLSVRFNSGG